MPKKKESKATGKEKTEDESPRLVEVYGNDVREEENLLLKSEVDSGLTKEEEGGVDKSEKRQTFKTEVLEDEVKEEVKEKNSSSEPVEELESSEEKDNEAFEEEIGSQKKAVRGVFGMGIVVFLVIFGITGWAFYLKTVWLPKETVGEVVVEASPEPVASPSPLSTPKPENREEIVLDVLNGSGVTGLAGKTAAIFEDLGYEIGVVGNADSVDENELYVKEDKLDVLGNLYEDVLKELNIASPAGYLDSNDKAMARIILGGN